MSRSASTQSWAKYSFAILVIGSLLALVTQEVTSAESRSGWQTLLELGFPLKRVRLDYQTQDFELRDQLGRAVRLSKYDPNTLILLHFWATDCPPCVKEFPELEHMIRMFRGANMAVLAVSRDKTRAIIDAFVARVGGISALLLHDPEQRVFKTFDVTKVPETFVIKNGTVLARFVGRQPWESKRFLHYLRLLQRLRP